MDYVIAFIVGGAICALVQILMEKTKMLPGRIMVLLVCLGTVLGAIGVYEPFSKWAGLPGPQLGHPCSDWASPCLFLLSLSLPLSVLQPEQFL